jgi:hypothetical protein
MRRSVISVIVLSAVEFALLAACGTPAARADFAVGKPRNLGATVNSTSSDGGGSTSADGLELYFGSNRPGGFGDWDIWVSRRPSTDDPWGPPANLGPPVNTMYVERYPSLSSDGLTLYFSELYPSMGPFRPGSLGASDIWMATRTSRNDPWTAPVNLGSPISSAASEISPTTSGDGLILIFSSSSARTGGSGGFDLWMSTRASAQDHWGVPVNLVSVNSSSHEVEPALSADGLALVFCSDRGPNVGSFDLWMTTRKSRQDPWSLPVNLGPMVNSMWEDGSPGFSSDMRTLYFDSNCQGGFGDYDLYEAPVIPIVDFNGDGKVDINDLLRLIESWGKDDPSVDMGPAPWGDGKVDEKDLEVFMSYWGQEINDPTLLACWKLDEASGMIAADSVEGHPGTLIGNPIWQPTGGKIKGALEFDGIDDGVTTPFVCDPSSGPFSVFAWVKGGAPGQVIVSQVNGVNWVMAGASSGGLATELQSSGRAAGKALISATRITDGAWHRVGFVWDGSNRVLYVDDVEVAKDTQTGLVASAGGLYLGAGSSRTATSFWKGLIDDVRIYSQAVKP